MTARHEVDAPVASVHAAMTGAAWPAALDARLKDGSTLVERTEAADGGLRVVVRRNLPAGIPGPVQRFAPADGAVVQTDVWDAPAGGVVTGRWAVEFAGAPGSLGGTTRLEPAGEGRTAWVVDGAVQIRLPLLGGRAEELLAPLVERLVATQADVLRTLV